MIENNTDVCFQLFDTMKNTCAKSCRICSTRDPNTNTLATGNNVTVHRIFAAVPQILNGKKTSIDAWLRIREIEDYMYNRVYVNQYYTDVREDCQLRNALCTQWAVQGECHNNPSYMKTSCAPACQSCRHIKFEHRCPLDQTGNTALAQPGDLYRMFDRILNNPQFASYTPRALSRPSNATVDDAPWVVVLDNVLTQDECDTLSKQAHRLGFKQSGEIGNTTRFDGLKNSVRSERRTSSTTWCTGQCANHDVAKALHQRIEELTQIPQLNYENLQMLKYRENERYVRHHDYLEHHLRRDSGVRMLTVYMYLNDVEAGGSTRFNDLDIAVQPKRGRVVIWPSVLDKDTSQKDPRTRHEAMPVERGVKYGTYAHTCIHAYMHTDSTCSGRVAMENLSTNGLCLPVTQFRS